MPSTTETGRWAEQQVANLIVRRGGVILAQNWRTRWSEIDIVATGRYGIRFIEVKYRRSTLYGSGFEAILPDKRQRLVRAARAWLMINGRSDGWAIDVVSVFGSTKQFEIEYMANAIQGDTL
ncbi:YraN family protein [Patescibacteria group bacterium]|nr:MAG: YraN family protein [Patescibacteria group bacterium]